MKKKVNNEKNTSVVLFSLPSEAVEGAQSVLLVGDFNKWKPIALTPQADGAYAVEIEIANGKNYHFRYKIDDRWENDWAADFYEISPLHHHIYNSVLSLASDNKIVEKKASVAANANKSSDDLTKIEGIGPKIAGLLNVDGILTFEQLANSAEKTLQGILDKAGKRYQIHNPSTWAKQAALAAKGEWAALKKWQDELNGGKMA